VSTKRDAILARIRDANSGRTPTDHPGDFGGWRGDAGPTAPLQAFVSRFEGVGGEVVFVDSEAKASQWLADFAQPFKSVTIGEGVSSALHPDLPIALPRDAPLSISQARGAIAETGSLVMDARDGRRTQLLAPTHVVVLSSENIWETVRGALLTLAEDLPAAIGLHSGPSKSADIGQVMVKGVHGPGRILALIIGNAPEKP
jgi:L-lactate dehydrogenase complex protein LldG